jgi:Protein of unknown function (DUF2934)
MSAAPQLSPESVNEERTALTEQAQVSGNEGVETSMQENIARLAYSLWQQRGCPTGSAEIDWIEAEQQINK